jgi:phosphoribosylaminoimidazolecarboxamide formyltransferase / IMP cyclohydrolase
MVDLYPFTETLASGASEQEIIEKIDIGGVSLIRAAAKNYSDVLIVSSRSQYQWLGEILTHQNGASTLVQRKQAAASAFAITAEYDGAIAAWFAGNKQQILRYGENPHQQAAFRGKLNEALEQLHGKALSYNNLLDVDAAVRLISDFPGSGCAIIKHNNACGAALDANQVYAWRKALQGDPTSAFGGIFIFNTTLSEETAKEVDACFSK